jgi:hypothetical protein
MIADKLLNAHLEQVKSAVLSFAPAAQVGFAAACISRQREVFVRAAATAEGLDNSQRALDGVLDQLWLAAANDRIADLRNAEPLATALAPEDFEAVNGPTAVVFTSVNAIRDFISAALDGETSYAHFMAARNIDLVEVLADEIEADCDPLMRAEMDRQVADLSTLQPGAGPQAIETLKARNAGVSLYGNFWFEPPG